MDAPCRSCPSTTPGFHLPSLLPDPLVNVLMNIVFLSPFPQRSEHFGSVQLKFYYFQTALPQKTCSEFRSLLPNFDVPQDTCRLKTLQTTSFPKPAILPMEISSHHHLITNIVKARAPSFPLSVVAHISISGTPSPSQPR